MRARYAKAFAQFPQNKAELKNRIAVGNTVVDHEHVIRAPGGEHSKSSPSTPSATG